MAEVMTAQKVAARTEDAVKVYGKGQTEVRALDGVTVWFAARRRERDAHVTTPVGLTVDRAIPQRAAIRLRLSSPGHGS